MESDKPVEYQLMGLQVCAIGAGGAGFGPRRTVSEGGIAVLSILNDRNNAEPINKALALTVCLVPAGVAQNFSSA